MALTVQNLRAVGTGVEPASLLPGQIAFNITDKIIYVGDGSNVRTRFNGTTMSGVPGEGWYAMPMDFTALSEYYVVNPLVYGDVPTDQQVLTWSTALNHPIWTSGGGGGGGSQVYVVTNADVAAAPGATTSDKITAAIGVLSPDEGDVTIVTGIPDDVYEGLYFFTMEWVKGAAYAYPSATEVIYDNTDHPTLTPTVQGAIDDLDDGLAATTSIANTANSTANSALSIANAALPKSGGTMSGTIVSRAIDVQSGDNIQFLGTGNISFNAGANGTITGITDLVSSTSSTLAGSANSVRVAYNLANDAIPRSSFTANGEMLVGTGAGVFGTIPLGAEGDVLVVSGGVPTWLSDAPGDVTSVTGTAPILVDNTDPENPVISIQAATTTVPGAVQLVNDTVTNDATQALTAAAGYDLQAQINGLSVATNVDLGGSLDCVTGLVDSVTAAGTAAGLSIGNPLPTPGLGNVDVYVIVTTGAASFTPPGGGGTYSPENGDWFLSNGTIWQYLGVGARPSYASTTVAGIVQLALASDVQGGLNNTLAVTPLGLQSKLSDSTATTSSTTIASSTAVKSAYDLANAALPKAGGTMTGDITLSGAGVGIVFGDASTVEAISDSFSTTSSTTAASSTAVKASYDLANAALPKSGGTMTGDILFNAGQTFPVSGIQDATAAQKGVVQVGTNINVSAGTISVATATTAVKGLVQVGSNIDVSAGTISVKSASTTQSGVVQLNDTVTSTSTTQALTANQGYNLQQQINALATSNNLTFAGTIDGSTGLMATVTVEGAGAGFAVSSALPSPSAAIDEFFVIVSVAGTMTPTGGTSTAVYVGDWWLASPTTWTYIAAGFQPPSASTTTAGIVELATNGETQTGTDANRAVTPASLQSKVSDSTSTTSSIAIASSTAVKSAYDLANAAVPEACYTALGALTAGTGSGTVGTLSVGTTGQFLAVNTACSTGLEWCTASLACVPCSAFTAKGDLLTGTGASTFTALSSGTAGQFLTIDTACPGNMKWVTAAGANLCGFTCTLTPFNTALGGLAGAALTGLSVANTAIGYAALDSETSGDFNTAVGHNALTAQNGSTGNTVVGGNAGAQVTTGACNTVMGYNAADALTTGSNNVAIGFNSLGAAVSATNNVAVGMNALALSTTGCQVAVGYCALASNGTGVSNTAVGYFSLSQLLAGSQNTAVGFGTGQVLSGQSNTLIGYNAGNSVTTASGNTLVGCSAGTGITTQDGHVAIGSQTLVGVLDINNRNLVAVGTCALRAVTTGLNNIGIGFCAGALITTGGCNIAIGAGALDSVTTSANNVGIGFSALTNITTGSENLGIGTCAGQAITTASNNTSVGYFAGCSTAINGNNTYFGAYAGRAQTSTNNTAVGACALANSGVNNNTAVGFNAGAALTTGGSNTFVGAAAGDNATTADNAVAIGYNALGAVHTAGGAVAIGVNALGAATSGACNVAVGFNAGNAVTTGSCNVLVGRSAGSSVTTGGCNVILGSYAGTATLANNVVLSDGAGNIKLQVNENGAVGVGSTPSYGTSGQILSSTGTAGAAAWTSSLPQVTAPTASTDAGVQGQIASDSTYFYMYTGGRWQRVAWDATVW